MRIPLLSLFITSPFEGIQEHAEKVKECAWVFQQAMECYLEKKCETSEDFRREIIKLENEADAIKRRVRGHLPKGTLMPVDKFNLFQYIREQDHVLDAVKATLNMVSFRSDPGIPGELHADMMKLVDTTIAPIEQLSSMVAQAREYFNTFSERQRVVVKEIIRKLRQEEHECDKMEDILKQKILNLDTDPVTVFHAFRVVESIGDISDYAENAGDMMRAMIAK